MLGYCNGSKLDDTFQLGLCTVANPIGCTDGALLLGCVGVGCSRMALVGCTQMATDTTGLLQRMLPRLDATHLAVCIAVSKLFETSPENRNHSQAFGCCQPCLPCMTDLVLPRLQTRQKSLSATFSIKTQSMHFQSFPTLCGSYRVHGALLLICIGIGCSEFWPAALKWLLGCVLPRLDAYRVHGALLLICIGILQSLSWVLPRLQTRQQSLSVTFSIQTHNRCISKAFQHFVQILSGARSFAARMHWGRMLSNGFGRLHSNGYGHNWAVATDVTKIRCYSPGGMHCSL